MSHATRSQNPMRQSMFGALKRFITEKVVGPEDDDQPEVSDPNFWPHIIIRCRTEWPQLDH